MYVNHIDEACSVIGLNVNWRTQSVNSVISVLHSAPNSRETISNIPPFAEIARFLSQEEIRNPLGHVGLLPYLIIRRLQPDSIPTIRAHTSVLLLATAPSSTKSALGLVSIRGGGGGTLGAEVGIPEMRPGRLGPTSALRLPTRRVDT